MADIADLGMEWRIWLAKHGDRQPLAELMRKYDKKRLRYPPMLRAFLIEVIAGSIELPGQLPRHKTYLWLARDRNLRQRLVYVHVRKEMGERRNKHDREKVMKKWCAYYGTTIQLVEEFIKRGSNKPITHGEIRRRLSAHGRRRKMGR